MWCSWGVLCLLIILPCSPKAELRRAQLNRIDRMHNCVYGVRAQSIWQRTNTQNYLLWWRTNVWSISIINLFCGFVLDLSWIVSHQIFLFYLPINTALQFLYKLILSISTKYATQQRQNSNSLEMHFSKLQLFPQMHGRLWCAFCVQKSSQYLNNTQILGHSWASILW